LSNHRIIVVREAGSPVRCETLRSRA